VSVPATDPILRPTRTADHSEAVGPTGAWRNSTFRTGVTLGLAVVFVIAVADIASSAQSLLVLIGVGALIAIALHRPVSRLAVALGGRRGWAIVLVGAGFAAIVTTTIMVVAPRAIRQVQEFGEQAPQITQRLGELPLIGDRLVDANVGERLIRWFDELPANLGRDTGPVVNAIGAVANGAASALIVFLVVVLLVLDGPRLLERMRPVLPSAAQRPLDRALPVVRDVVGRYFIGSILVAVMAGLVMLVAGLVLSVPLAPLVAIWITMTNLIPQIGGFLGGAAFVGLGVVESPTTGVICLAVFLAYQQLENHLIGPYIIGEAVDISPLVALVAALLGLSVLGVLGALIAVPLVGVVKAVAEVIPGTRFSAAPGSRAEETAPP
jgi:predicted PurR-regulated permease PerM